MFLNLRSREDLLNLRSTTGPAADEQLFFTLQKDTDFLLSCVPAFSLSYVVMAQKCS
jgi:hypothetical protein